MLRKWLKKHLPGKNSIHNDSSMSLFNRYLPHPYLWRLNCTGISRGTVIGLFVAFIPLPFQMIIAAFLSLLCRANLPIALALTWITNPFTFVPINYFIYWVGKKILGESVENMTVSASQLGKAYFIGLPVVAIGAATLGYFIIRLVWYLSVIFSKHSRRKKKSTA